VALCGVGEAVHDVGSGDALVGGAVQQVPGVVVEPVEDFDVGAVGEGPVSRVMDAFACPTIRWTALTFAPTLTATTTFRGRFATGLVLA
jgi:hypothetical protein